jgi:hypothetical protein
MFKASWVMPLHVWQSLTSRRIIIRRKFLMFWLIIMTLWFPNSNLQIKQTNFFLALLLVQITFSRWFHLNVLSLIIGPPFLKLNWRLLVQKYGGGLKVRLNGRFGAELCKIVCAKYYHEEDNCQRKYCVEERSIIHHSCILTICSSMGNFHNWNDPSPIMNQIFNFGEVMGSDVIYTWFPFGVEQFQMLVFEGLKLRLVEFRHF